MKNQMMKTLNDMVNEFDLVSAIPVDEKLPTNNSLVSFWLAHRINPIKTNGNSLTGIYSDGMFCVDSESWGITEVTHWIYLGE